MHFSTSWRVAITFGAFVCLSGMAPTAAVAQPRSLVTIVTVHTPTRVPGAVLTPGRYEFRIAAGANFLVMIRGLSHSFNLNVRAVGISRSEPGAIVGLSSPLAGYGAALATWYPDGGTVGYQFIPHEPGPQVLSATALTTLDGRLLVADNAVSDARNELRVAESSREAIRTERRNAR
jgi:hypothetical protein